MAGIHGPMRTRNPNSNPLVTDITGSISNSSSTLPTGLSPKAIKRLSVLRRLLTDLSTSSSSSHIRSRQMADLCGCESSQIRRDLMNIQATGRPGHGYDIQELLRKIDSVLNPAARHKVALVGVGNLGRALITFFRKTYHSMELVALFDVDPVKTGRVLHGVRSYSFDQFRSVVREQGIELALLAVPESIAQEVADQMVAAGIRGIMSFGTMTIQVPRTVGMENIDITASLDRLGFFIEQCSDRSSHSEV